MFIANLTANLHQSESLSVVVLVRQTDMCFLISLRRPCQSWQCRTDFTFLPLPPWRLSSFFRVMSLWKKCGIFTGFRKHDYACSLKALRPQNALCPLRHRNFDSYFQYYLLNVKFLAEKWTVNGQIGQNFMFYFKYIVHSLGCEETVD